MLDFVKAKVFFCASYDWTVMKYYAVISSVASREATLTKLKVTWKGPMSMMTFNTIAVLIMATLSSVLFISSCLLLFILFSSCYI